MKNAEIPSNTHEEYVPRRPRRPARETGRLGKEIYERDIRPRVEPDHIGKYVAIDVDSGCWALGESIEEALERIREQRPEAVDALMLRVGYEAVVGLGGGAPRRTA